MNRADVVDGEIEIDPEPPPPEPPPPSAVFSRTKESINDHQPDTYCQEGQTVGFIVPAHNHSVPSALNSTVKGERR